MSRIRRPNREFAVEKLRQLISAGLDEEDEAILQKLESSDDSSDVEEVSPPTDQNNAESSPIGGGKQPRRKRDDDDDDSDYSIKSDAYAPQDDSDVDSSFDDTEDSKELISSSSNDGEGRKKPKKASKAEKEAQKQIRAENKVEKKIRKGDARSTKGGTLGEVRLRAAAKVYTQAQRMEMALSRAKEQTLLLRKMEEEASAAIANDTATDLELMALSKKRGRNQQQRPKKKMKPKKKAAKKRGGQNSSDSISDDGTNEAASRTTSAGISQAAIPTSFLSDAAKYAFLRLCEGAISGERLSAVEPRLAHGKPRAPVVGVSGSSSDIISDHHFECSDTPSFTMEERRKLGLNTVREQRKLVARRRLRHKRMTELSTRDISTARQFPLVTY